MGNCTLQVLQWVKLKRSNIHTQRELKFRKSSLNFCCSSNLLCHVLGIFGIVSIEVFAKIDLFYTTMNDH